MAQAPMRIPRVTCLPPSPSSFSAQTAFTNAAASQSSLMLLPFAPFHLFAPTFMLARPSTFKAIVAGGGLVSTD
jgi:hypothetical protein